MEVYQLSPKSKYRVLVVGESEEVYDICNLLHGSGIDFSVASTAMVLYSFVELLDMPNSPALDRKLEHTDLMGQSDEHYGKGWPFSNRVTSDPLREDPFHIIVDAYREVDEDRLSTIRTLAERFPDAVFLSTLYSCTATEMSSISEVDSDFVGFAMVPGMDKYSSIDVARSLLTKQASLDKVVDLFHVCGVKAEVVEDRVGLVQMRTLCMLINEAAFALMEGVATAEEIDNAMVLGVNYPRGLLAWADTIGIDVVLLVLESLNREYTQERYRPCVLLKQYVRAGWTGKLAKRGFYQY